MDDNGYLQNLGDFDLFHMTCRDFAAASMLVFLHHAHGISIAFLVCVLEVKSPPVLRSGEPFDESLGQGAFFLS